MNEHATIKVAWIASAGGGPIDAIEQVRTSGDWPFSTCGIITNQECGAERVAAKHAINLRRIDQCRRNRWSVEAARILRMWQPDVVVLLFDRLIGPAVWCDLGVPVWNVHPALLPEFAGLRAFERSYADARQNQCERRLGVTLHLVDGGADTGPVIAQGRFDVSLTSTMEAASHLCHLMKVALVLDGLRRLSMRDVPAIAQAQIDGIPWSGQFRPQQLSSKILDAVSRLAQPWAARAFHEPMQVAT